MTLAATPYSPVWFSTDRQFEALFGAYQSASLMAKLAGRFDVPEDAAQLQGLLLPWMHIPLVLMAQGEFIIGAAELTYRSTPYRAFGWKARSPHMTLSFTLQRAEVLAVEQADVKSPVVRIFDLPFTRVRTVRSAPLDNFLVCVGGRIAVPRIRARSQELRKSLLAWQAQGPRIPDEALCR